MWYTLLIIENKTFALEKQMLTYSRSYQNSLNIVIKNYFVKNKLQKI